MVKWGISWSQLSLITSLYVTIAATDSSMKNATATQMQILGLNANPDQPEKLVERVEEQPEEQVEIEEREVAHSSQNDTKKGGKRTRRSFFEEVPIDQYSNLSIKVTELTR